MIWLAIKTVVRTYQSVLKRPHDYEALSDSWPTDDEGRVIRTWSAVVYLWWLRYKVDFLLTIKCNLIELWAWETLELFICLQREHGCF